jgi:tetratricopeptide (TPR) repeat protein
LFQKLWNEHPEVPKFHVYAVMSDCLMAEFLEREGQIDEAMRRCQRGIETLERFTHAHADRSGFDRNLLQDYCTSHWAYNSLAALQSKRNDPRAIETLEAAAQHWRRLQDVSPAPADVQLALAQTLNRIGQWYREAGRLAEARAALEQARDAIEVIARENPEVTAYTDTLDATEQQRKLLDVEALPANDPTLSPSVPTQ